MKVKFVLGVTLLVFINCLELVSTDSSTAAARAACKSACDRVKEQICANNGITYANRCLFNCAKARNNRLRIVKSGSCAGTSLREYRNKGTTRRPATSPFLPRRNSNQGSRGTSIWDSWFRF